MPRCSSWGWQTARRGPSMPTAQTHTAAASTEGPLGGRATPRGSLEPGFWNDWDPASEGRKRGVEPIDQTPRDHPHVVCPLLASASRGGGGACAGRRRLSVNKQEATSESVTRRHDRKPTADGDETRPPKPQLAPSTEATTDGQSRPIPREAPRDRWASCRGSGFTLCACSALSALACLCRLGSA